MTYNLRMIKIGPPTHMHGHRQIRCAHCTWKSDPFWYSDREREVAGYFAGREHKCPKTGQ